MAEEKDPQDEEDQNAAPAGDAEDGDSGEGGGGLDAKKIVLMVVLPLLVLVGLGGGLYFSGILDSFLKAPAEEEAQSEEQEEYEENDGQAHFIEIPTIIVNLNTDDGTPRYLRLSVQLEVASAEDVPKVEAVTPRVIDQFQTYLRELRVEDLRGSAGIYRLQMELLWRVNQAAAPVEIKDVLFQEILIQ